MKEAIPLNSNIVNIFLLKTKNKNLRNLVFRRIDYHNNVIHLSLTFLFLLKKKIDFYTRNSINCVIHNALHYELIFKKVVACIVKKGGCVLKRNSENINILLDFLLFCIKLTIHVSFKEILFFYLK